MRSLILLFIVASLLGCSSHSSKNVIDTTKTVATATSTSKQADPQPKEDHPKSFADSVAEFERRIYLEIGQVYTGKTYIDKNNRNVFNRVLVVPEEENIMLIAENISFGDEGGNFKLVKLSRITDDGSVLPRFGLSSVDSLKFIDSVDIQGFFNHKKMIITLNKLKPYHPFFTKF